MTQNQKEVLEILMTSNEALMLQLAADLFKATMENNIGALEDICTKIVFKIGIGDSLEKALDLLITLEAQEELIAK